MSPATRRVAAVRAREWRELLARGKSTVRSVRDDSAAITRRDPALAIGVAALLGLAAMAAIQRRATIELRLAGSSPARGQPEAHEAGAGRSILWETLTKAAGAWLIQSMTQPRAHALN